MDKLKTDIGKISGFFDFVLSKKFDKEKKRNIFANTFSFPTFLFFFFSFPMNNIPSPSVEEGYGYGGKIEQLRKKDFARLEGEGEEEGEGEGEGEGKGPITYLDHAGATLYASSQIDGVGKMLKESVLGNPHSKNPSSLQTHENIEQARKKVLSYFNADPALYSVVFTSGLFSNLCFCFFFFFFFFLMSFLFVVFFFLSLSLLSLSLFSLLSLLSLLSLFLSLSVSPSPSLTPPQAQRPL